MGFDAGMLAGWMKSMGTMYGKKLKRAKGKSWDAPPILNSRQQWVVDTFKFLQPHMKFGKVRRVMGKVSFII